MTIDEYFKRIREIAAESCRDPKSVHEFLPTQPDFEDLVATRTDLLDQADIASVVGLLSIGFFKERHSTQRLGAFRVCLDVEALVALLSIRDRCRPYPDSPLLKALPGLGDFVVDDLVRATSIAKVPILADVVKVTDGFVRLDPDLSPALAAWVVGTYPADRVRLRFDPRSGGGDQPKASLREHVIRVPNPTWWKVLGLHRGTTDSGCFELSIDMGHDAYWEYAVKGVRRLEVFVKRENQGRLSMMVEELSARDEANGFVLGRCIHLDSESPEGTPFDEAELKHIDLAINVYEGDRIAARWNQKLSDGGKIVDASCRTHLIRVDGAKFPILSILPWISLCLRRSWPSGCCTSSRNRPKFMP